MISLLNYICVRMLLKDFENEEIFYTKLTWVVLTLPMYNFICSWFRLIGSINVSSSNHQWNSLSFRDESHNAFKVVKKDFHDLERNRN